MTSNQQIESIGKKIMRLPIHIMCLLLLFSLSSSAFSQSSVAAPDTNTTTQLNVVQSVFEAKLAERKTLRQEILVAAPDDIADLELSLKELNAEITELRDSFEQIAVGSVDLSVFDDNSEEFDWRFEMTQVMMPIIRNLQSLTEKPRRIEALRSEITRNQVQLAAANKAVAAIEESVSTADVESTRLALTELKSNWVDQGMELQRSIEVANVKLDNLQRSDGNFFESIKTGLLGFITGRGLTLLIAFVSAFAVWYIAKLITKLLLVKNRGEAAKNYRTRQRIVHYAFNILTVFLMAVAIIVVFYVRGDVLLLGVTLLVTAATLIGLRHMVPKFLSEARLLLNLGSIREDERVVYNGLPFKVTQLNMYSILKNPELTGVVRLPLENMMGMISRPAGKEVWFPASKGDYILMPDGKLLEVIALTTELIQLQNLVGTKTSVPAADFYNMTFDNLSRGDIFSITSTFGVGYLHQSISNDNIPLVLQQSVANALEKADFAEHVVSVAVELQEAGASSLDYWVNVSVSSAAVRSYFKISRIIQQTCVATCTKEGWDIPFPQLTIHNSPVPSEAIA